ncbi:MAG: nucleotidyltransferase domain-containing protein, partial [Candidatus Eremiobacteraeota bacterium]|nr:nucleotidyltransferase domain-containing protein [Candidatus Eremiobacteraeota bacterium]
MKLANLVAKTDIFPLRSIYQAIYWRGIHSLMTLVKREKGVLGIYLTGSFLTGEHTHGISDVDLYFIVRGDCRQSKFEIRRHLTRCATYFPFLGPVEERVGKVFFADREDGLLNNPDLDYLWDTGYLKPLWEAPGFTYRPSTPRPARALSEIHKLLYFVLHRTREGLDPLSFWRSRIRVLKRLAEYVGHGLSLPPEVEALVEQPGGEVAGREDDELAELCLKTVVSSICEIKRTLGEGLVLDRTIRVSHHAPQEDSIPGAPEICETITEISRERLKDGCGPVMVKLPGFRVLLCYSVSIWHPLHSSTVCDLDRPWVFQPGKTEHRVNGELWDWQIDGILEKLKLQIEQLSAREPWLLGNDQRLMTGLLESKQLRAVSAVGMELYWSRESVVSALRQAFPDQKIFLDELERRCEELNEIEVDLEAGLWEREPTQVGAPNFFGHLVDFAENVA